MTIGISDSNRALFSSATFCEPRLGETSIYRLLHDEGGRLFPDEAFADLFQKTGRRSVPPREFATVMVLQRIEGLSDREAVERFAYDLRWKYAAGDLSFEHPSFVHTVLVDVRERLRRSARPNRIFEAVIEVAKAAGLVGRKRVLDSTPLYDAVATQDTVTMIRSAIRGLLRVVAPELGQQLRAVLRRDDDYEAPGKPACDWSDETARNELVDALARDGYALLSVLDSLKLAADVRSAASLLATVLGQDLEEDEQGVFKIARKVARDRVLSTVDPDARHGHKTSAKGFDGYKGHVAVDPDSEIITATAVTPGNAGDTTAVSELLDDILVPPNAASGEQQSASTAPVEEPRPEVYGDAAYGSAEVVEQLEAADIEVFTKVQTPVNRAGRFSQAAFDIDTSAGKVRCPNGVEVPLRPRKDGSAQASFGAHCVDCPLRAKCTTSKDGRSVNVHEKHDTLHRVRQQQQDPGWKKRYRSTRPKVERKFGQMMRRKHGGRRARVRGRARVGHDFALLAAAVNLQRLAALHVRHREGGWEVGTPK